MLLADLLIDTFQTCRVMKTKRKELDVDFIGEQRDLTQEEEQAISDYIKQNKTKKAKKSSSKGKTDKQLT